MSHVSRNTANVQSTILSWQEALAIVEKCDAKGVPIPFAVAFCTADESAGTGGEIIRYDRAVWYVPGGRVRKSDSFQQAKAKPDAAARSGKSRWTRRIQGVGTDQIRQIHLHLIMEINGCAVR